MVIRLNSLFAAIFVLSLSGPAVAQKQNCLPIEAAAEAVSHGTTFRHFRLVDDKYFQDLLKLYVEATGDKTPWEQASIADSVFGGGVVMFGSRGYVCLIIEISEDNWPSLLNIVEPTKA